jgi:GNAT superfamily N-acetyltransferase
MVTYKRCIDAGYDLTYQAFKAGFCDYMIPLDMPQEAFVKRFFGPEGNSLEHSFVACAGNQPIGLVLGGIRLFDGLKTMRCGTMCVIPEYRLRGVSVQLFELHKEEGKKTGCRQLFLEVIQSNLPAVRFYKRCGYKTVYDIRYFAYTKEFPLAQTADSTFAINEITMDELKKLRRKLAELHINWQNEIEYIEKLDGERCFGIYAEQGLAAAISFDPKGKFHFLWVDPARRNKGMATALLNHCIQTLHLTRLDTGLPNNALLECFLTHSGFIKDKLAQYEMYLTI